MENSLLAAATIRKALVLLSLGSTGKLNRMVDEN
jgi:hypothetical protein